MVYKLERKKKISSKQSYGLIMMVAKHSNIDKNLRTKLTTDDEVKKFFEQHNINFDELIEKCRDYYGKNVPLIENLAPSTAKAEIQGRGSITYRDNSTGKELKLEESGIIETSAYWSSYEKANEEINGAVESANWADFKSAIVDGVSSIEGYINYKAEQWRFKNPKDQSIDVKQRKLSLEDKIDNWIPIITGKKLYKNTKCWSNFKILLSIRHDKKVHSKESSQSITYKELAELINRFSTGIAGLMLQLHLIFGDRIPRIIVRGYYSPDVEVINR